MKTILIITMINFIFISSAMAGDKELNGGDSCEARLVSIKDDLLSWINKGGAKLLELPPKITIDAYQDKMIHAMKNSVLSCTDETLKLGESLKSCLNTQKIGENPRVNCNTSRIKGTSQSDLYILMHHEFAGIAKLEVNKGKEQSDYRISNQISSYLEDVIVKKLVITPTMSIQE